MSGIKLVCGLGNPGDKYAQTRHNAGFWFLGKLADNLSISLASNTRFKALIGEQAKSPKRTNALRLIAPQTFMNKSGESLVPFAKFYQIEPQNILVVHDEIDLPPGTVRLKVGGGHGGHNGLRDIIRLLGHNDFNRLRIGVGRPANSQDVVSEVLKRPPVAEFNLIDEAMDRVMLYWSDIQDGDFAKAMNALHQQ